MQWIFSIPGYEPDIKLSWSEYEPDVKLSWSGCEPVGKKETRYLAITFILFDTNIRLVDQSTIILA